MRSQSLRVAKRMRSLSHPSCRSIVLASYRTTDCTSYMAWRKYVCPISTTKTTLTDVPGLCSSGPKDWLHHHVERGIERCNHFESSLSQRIRNVPYNGDSNTRRQGLRCRVYQAESRTDPRRVFVHHANVESGWYTVLERLVSLFFTLCM
jgi:hypothetical protein